jgi:hypothetical protein
MAILECSACFAFETIPSFFGIHSAVNRVDVAKLNVTLRTDERRCGRIGLADHAGRSSRHLLVFALRPQFAFGLKPIIPIVSRFSAALFINLICAVPNCFVSGLRAIIGGR